MTRRHSRRAVPGLSPGRLGAETSAESCAYARSTCTAAGSLGFSSEDLGKNHLVQGQVRDHVTEPGVLRLDLLQTFRLVRCQTTTLVAPAMQDHQLSRRSTSAPRPASRPEQSICRPVAASRRTPRWMPRHRRPPSVQDEPKKGESAQRCTSQAAHQVSDSQCQPIPSQNTIATPQLRVVM